MKQKTELSLTLLQLEQMFMQELPDWVYMARESLAIEKFKARCLNYLDRHANLNLQAKEQIKRLIAFDRRCVNELSTECMLTLSTFTILYSFLRHKWEKDLSVDCLLDIYHQLKRLYSCETRLPSRKQILDFTKRWPSGLDADVRQLRMANRERIIHALVQKISCTRQTSARYHFKDNLTYDEKWNLVNSLWNDYRFQLSMAVRSPEELNSFLDNSLSDETMYLLSSAHKKGIPFFVTPYYLSLLNCTPDGYDDQTLRSYIIYSPQLVDTFGHIHAWEKEDVVEYGKPNTAGWLLPDGHNIHRRYPEVAILIPDTMGRACGGLCASCQRMYDFQSKRFHFDLPSLGPKENWKDKLERLLSYFEHDTQLRDILITGGDALMSQNKTLQAILDAVYDMASRKRKANRHRPEGEKYAELQRVRLGTRLPVYLPMRVDDELVEILSRFKEKASKVGIRQFIIQTHFITPLEVTPEAAECIRRLLSAGWLMDNQLVYNVAASRRGHTTKLRQELNRLGVLCYYTFTVKGFEENYAVFTPNARSLQEQHEEKRAGKLTEHEACLLVECIGQSSDVAACIRSFMESRRLPFLSTDRSVLNLPGIGKSMTFELVGITEQGKRVLCFDHDGTRRHSPIIDQLGKVYIVENKSIASYLRQLDHMGEDVNEYDTLWEYTEGRTEPRFSMYEYPNYDFKVTDEVTNLADTVRLHDEA